MNLVIVMKYDTDSIWIYDIVVNHLRALKLTAKHFNIIVIQVYFQVNADTK